MIRLMVKKQKTLMKNGEEDAVLKQINKGDSAIKRLGRVLKLNEKR
jgi:hypothetical protein